MSDPPTNFNDSLLLSGLPDAEWERLRPLLKEAAWGAHTVLHRAGDRIEHVHFPRDGYVSLMVELADGFQAEAAHIGNEGMVRIPLLHEATTDAASAIVQVPTITLSMPAETFLGFVGQLPVLRTRLLRYAGVSNAYCMQLAACIGHHSLASRLARSLLSIHDQVHQNDIDLTHETLAAILGAHRPSVSVAAKQLERAGAIRCKPGRVSIVSRTALERMSCECYQPIIAISSG